MRSLSEVEAGIVKALAWDRVHSLCGQRHGWGLCSRWALLAADICGLSCGAALEVGGTKSCGSGSTSVAVLAGGEECPGGRAMQSAL